MNNMDGSCLRPFTQNTFTLSSCCTLPGNFSYSFFNRDTVNFQNVDILPQIITQSQEHTRVNWPTNAPQISVNFVAPPIAGTPPQTVLREYYTIFPGVARFGTLLFSFSGPPTTTAYIQRTSLAGPTGRAGCFNTQITVPLSDFETRPLVACAASTNPLTPVSVDPYFPQGT